MELSWAWELMYRERACRNHMGKKSVIFLAETLTDEARLEQVQHNIDFDHRWVVQREGQGRGLVLFWKSTINLKIVGSHRY